MPSSLSVPPKYNGTISFMAIADDGSRDRHDFDTRAEAETAADAYCQAGFSICWIAWSDRLQRHVTIPED